MMTRRLCGWAGLLRACLLAGLLAGPARTLAAATLTVEVRDTAGQPVVGASVTCKGGRGAPTDAAGRARLEGLSGRVTVTVSGVGFTGQTFSLELPAEGQVGRQVVLASADVQGGPVTVKGERGNGITLEGGRATERLDAATAAALATDGSARAALGSLAGIDTRPCGLCGSSGVGMQGLDPNYTEVRLDGLAVMCGVGALYGLEAVGISSLSSLDVTRGATTAAEGGGAIAGAVSLDSRRPDGRDTLQLRMAVGDGWRHGLGLTVGRRLGALPALAVLDWQSDPRRLDRNGDALTDTPQLGRLSGQLTLAGEGNAWRWSLFGSALDERRFAGDTAWETSDRGSTEVYGRDIALRRGELRAKAEGDLAAGRRWTAAAALVHHHQDSWYGPTAFDAVQHRWLVQGGLEQRWRGEALTSLQLAWLDDDYRDGLSLPTDRRDRVPSLSLSHSGMTGPWSWEGGLRVERQAEGVVALGRGSLATAPVPDLTLRLSAGQGYRPVTLFSLDKAVHAGFDHVALPEVLKPERSLSLNLALQHTRNLLSGRWQGDLSLFAVEFREKALLRYTAEAGHLVYGNADRAFSRGVEVRGAWTSWGGWRLAANGTWSRVRVHLPEGWRAEELTGAWTAGASVERLDLAGVDGLAASLRLRATGPQVMPEGRGRDRTPVWSVLDLGVSRPWSGWTLGLDVENLLDYVQPDSPLVAGGLHEGMLDSALIYGPLIGRRFRLRATLDM